jgi:hypothetical protein
LTSQFANKDTILGTFGSGENIMPTSNPNLHFQMEAKEDKFFESAVWGAPPNEKTRTHSLDLVIGSGHAYFRLINRIRAAHTYADPTTKSRQT